LLGNIIIQIFLSIMFKSSMGLVALTFLS
jgi:hypothetical protein